MFGRKQWTKESYLETWARKPNIQDTILSGEQVILKGKHTKSVKMWFMYMLSWISMVLQISFITLSIAAGLYYMAELVEEYTVMTQRLIKYMIWATTAANIGLMVFESMPLSLTGLGLLTNVLFYLILKTFPFIELTSPVFISAVVFIVINHYMAFSYFATVWHPFSEVLAFFTICLWLVPFSFFVSLSANENVLPTSVGQTTKSEDDQDLVTNYFRKNSRRVGLLSFLKSAQDTILPQRVKKGY